MKRIYIAIALLAASIAIGIFETVNVSQGSQKYIDYIEEINMKLDNDEINNAAVLCKMAGEDFEEMSKTLMFYYMHKNLEEIEGNLSSMYEYLRHDEVHDYYATAAITKEKLESMRDTGSIKFQNIL